MPIELHPHFVTITGQHVQPVRRALTTTIKQFRLDSGNLSAAEPQQQFHFVDQDGGIQIALGLVPRAIRSLREAGVGLQVTGSQLMPSEGAADYDFCERTGFRTGIRELSAVLCANYRGQIAFERPGDDRQVAATIIASYPTQRVLIVARRRRELRGLASWLTRSTGTRVFCDQQAAFQVEQRKLVVTTEVFGAANTDDWDVIVLLSPDAVLGNVSMATARRVTRFAQMYCLRPSTALLSQHEELLLESVAGPVVFTCPGHRGRLARVQLMLVDGPHKPIAGQFTAGTPTVDLKRAFYWQNQHRNELVATLATAISNQDETALIPHVPALRQPQAAALDITQPTVSILVQNREHAAALHQLLPDWRIISNNDQHSPDDRCIVTELAAAQQYITSTFLINASGNELTEHTCFPAASEDEQRPVQTLLDFTDDFHALAAARATSRLHAYRTANYDIRSNVCI